MGCFIHKTYSINIILMSLNPAGLSVSLPIIQVQVSIVRTPQQLPAVAAEGHAEDAELPVIWTQRERLVLLLESEDGDLVQAV